VPKDTYCTQLIRVRYWSEAHQIYIRCSLIIAAANAHIQIVIF